MSKTCRAKDEKEKADKPDGTYVAVPRKTASETPNLRGDWSNVFLLVMLYTIQGFPIGLAFSFSSILQSTKKVTYTQQAKLSLAYWPFIIKILWAPVIDALYVQWIGRRKSWILPLQLLMGSFLVYIARNIEDWLLNEDTPNFTMLLFAVFVLNFLSATQDIVVDGWSLTMLKRKNVGYASTCNTVGVPIGMFMSSICFTLLVSEDFKSRFMLTIPGSGGLITMQSFFYFWAAFVFFVTTIIGVFKKEKQSLEFNHEKINVIQNYKLLWKILNIPNMKILAIALLTARIGFSTTEAVSHLKLIDAGVSKESIMIINSFMYAAKFLLPIFVSKYITGPKPMSYYLKMTPIRLIWGVIYSIFIYFTPRLIHICTEKNDVSMYYYLALGFVHLISEMLSLFMQLAIMSFFCRLSDPRFGGTYMTLFNTFFYVGWLIPNTFVLNLVDLLTFNECHKNPECFLDPLTKACQLSDTICEVYVDGYYVSIAICTVIGFIWYIGFKNIIKHYQSLSLCHWMVFSQGSNIEEIKEPCIISSA